MRRLAQGGAKVVIVDRDEARGAGAREGARRRRSRRPTSPMPAQVEAAIAEASALGALRIAVSCAGVGWAARTLDKTGKPHDLDLFKTVIGVNLVGTFNVLRLAAAAIAKTDAARARRARRDRQHRVGRGVRRPDRPDRVRGVEGGRRRHDAAGGARPRARRHPRRHDRAGHLRHADARRAARGQARGARRRRRVPQAARLARRVRRDGRRDRRERLSQRRDDPARRRAAHAAEVSYFGAGTRSAGILFGISGIFCSYSHVYVKNAPSTRLV